MRHLYRVIGRRVLCVVTGAVFALFALVMAGLPQAAAAAAPTWLVPAGGETWTAGTTHTIEWSGGDPTGVFAVAYVEQFTPNGQYVIPGLAFFVNNGTASWSIPANLTPGTYQLEISSSGITFSADFTIVAPPECLVNCQLVTASFPAMFPPGTALPIGACGNSAAAAMSLAHQFVYAALSGQCFSGYALDPASVVIDVTLLPLGVCYSGYNGPFIAEASGFGCCCPNPTATKPATWGILKNIFK